MRRELFSSICFIQKNSGAALLSSMNTKNGAIEASEPTVIKNSDVVENASEENGKIDITEPVNKEYIREKAHDKSVNVVAAGAIDKENSCAEENSSSNSATIITTEQVIEDNKYIGEKEQTSHHVELSNLIQDGMKICFTVIFIIVPPCYNCDFIIFYRQISFYNRKRH